MEFVCSAESTRQYAVFGLRAQRETFAINAIAQELNKECVYLRKDNSKLLDQDAKRPRGGKECRGTATMRERKQATTMMATRNTFSYAFFPWQFRSCKIPGHSSRMKRAGVVLHGDFL